MKFISLCFISFLISNISKIDCIIYFFYNFLKIASVFTFQDYFISLVISLVKNTSFFILLLINL